MELEWFEKNLIIALRILLPFFKKYKFHLCNLDINSRDGDYLIFCSLFNNTKVSVIINPGFDILIERKKGFFNLVNSNQIISLTQEKKYFPKFASLPSDYKNVEELGKLLKEYTLFIEDSFVEYLK
ncbi:MAG: hypothetical protein GX419_07775 [Bacteroidales bacterium]|nr:hypothetical protein [Bacteroidales bacterium]